ncbi:MAG: hypothetical protein JO234_09020 [Hyphomicrobiales bacterium]|nr:hypothetical protein [Hyphomicrobiales bacterium]
MAHFQAGAFFGQSTSRGADLSGDDSRTLAAVFQDIMPVLARIQMRSPQMPAPGTVGHMSAEAVAATALVADLGADNLRRLTAYLDDNAASFEGLEHCAPLVAAAARALAARDYAQTFTLLFDVYRTIAMLRSEEPKLPMPGSIKSVQMEGRRSGDERGSEGDDQGASQGQPH